MADHTRTPTRVWALPDGRIAVRVPNPLCHTQLWMLVDARAGTSIAAGELSDDAVEITRDPDTQPCTPGVAR